MTPSAQSPLVLVCGSDDRYAMPLGVMLFSALSRLSPDYAAHVYVLDGGIREHQRRRLHRVTRTARADAQMEFVTPPGPALQGLVRQKYFTEAAYLRVLTPELVSADYPKAIYLDSDMLVQGDLSELWQQEMGDGSLLAVQDELITHVSHPEGLRNYAELGLSPDLPYFNSGLLVMNLCRWREEGVSARVMQYLRDHAAEIRYADQDAMNAILAGQWKDLGPRWNVMTCFVWPDSWKDDDHRRRADEHRDLLQGPGICHFAGHSKPWQPSCRHRIKFRWLRALWRSGWFTGGERVLWFANYFARHCACPARDWLTEVRARRGA